MTAIEDQARSLFLAALERAPDQWPTFLDEVCAGEVRLWARVEELLRAHQAMGSIHAGRGGGAATTVDLAPAERPGARLPTTGQPLRYTKSRKLQALIKYQNAFVPAKNLLACILLRLCSPRPTKRCLSEDVVAASGHKGVASYRVIRVGPGMEYVVQSWSVPVLASWSA